MTYRPLPVRLSIRWGERSTEQRFRGIRRQAPAFVLGLLVALVAASPALADPTVASKRAEAQRIMGEVQQMDAQLEHAIEAYNLASTKLAGLQADLKTNTHRLTVAKSNLRFAQTTLSQRVVALYKGNETNSTIAVILGAQSLDDLVTRLDTVSRVSTQDTRVMRQVRRFEKTVKLTQHRLKAAESAQRRLVGERASQKASIESQLSRRQSLLASVKDEIQQLQAEEQARQARLARAVQSRLASQQQQATVQALGSVDEMQATSSSAGEAPVAAAPPSRFGGAVGIAMQYLGIPYVWGGSSPSGFDCSGFTMYVYAQLGVSLPHNAAMQYGTGVPVSKDQLEPGDLVFFNGLGHMGMYIGGGQFIHAPHTGDVVKISSLSDSWYAQTWVGARRVT
jgi:cell wall-associated NlpC family hydrolase